MKITAWEHGELLEYFEDYHFWWTGNDEKTLFVRTDEIGEALVAVTITPPLKTGPYRLYTVDAIPQAWSIEQSDDHLLDLMTKWTSYSARKEMENVLVTELKHDPQTAMAAAIMLSRIAVEPHGEPETYPVQESLIEASTVPPASAPQPNERLWLLASHGGGWLKIALRHGMLHAEVSVRNEISKGFGHTLRGIIRPRYRSPEREAEFLFGWRSPVIEGEVEDLQQQLGIPPDQKETRDGEEALDAGRSRHR